MQKRPIVKIFHGMLHPDFEISLNLMLSSNTLQSQKYLNISKNVTLRSACVLPVVFNIFLINLSYSVKQSYFSIETSGHFYREK